MMRRILVSTCVLFGALIGFGEEESWNANGGLIEDTIGYGTLPGTVLKHNHIYRITDDKVFIDASGLPGVSALRVPVGAAVVIDIAANKTFSVKGGNGYGKIPGGAGIEVPYGAKLVVTGGAGSRLKAEGGNAADGGMGYGGLEGEWGAYIAPDKITDDKRLPCPRNQIPPPDEQHGIKSTSFCQEPLIYGRAGCGGVGGTGGGGAGAGIGGAGGGGGEGGLGGISSLISNDSVYKERSENVWNSCLYFGIPGYFIFNDGQEGKFAENGTNGADGKSGDRGRACGEVVIAGTVSVEAKSGAEGQGGVKGPKGSTLRTTTDQEKDAATGILQKGKTLLTKLGGTSDTMRALFKGLGTAAKKANPVLKIVDIIERALDSFGYFAIDRLSRIHWYTGGGGGAGGAGGAAAPGGVGQGGAGGGGGGGGGAGLFIIGAGSVYKVDWLGKPDGEMWLDLGGHGGGKGNGCTPALSGNDGGNVALVDYSKGRPYNSKDGRIGAWSWVQNDNNWAWGGWGANGGWGGATNGIAFKVWVANGASCGNLAPSAEKKTFTGNIEYGITFMDGTRNLGTRSYIAGTICGAAPATGSESAGHYFMGYYSAASAGVQYFDRFRNPVEGATISANITLYAQWSATDPDQGIKTVVPVVSGTLTAGQTLEPERVYHFTQSITLTGTSGPALSLKTGRTVFYIDAGMTVTLNGGNGGMATAGSPGLEVPEGATLIVAGEGTLNAKGGNAGWGENGETGHNAVHARASTSDEPEYGPFDDEEIAALKEELEWLFTQEGTNADVIAVYLADFDIWLHNPTNPAPEYVNVARANLTNGNGGYGGQGGGGAAPGIGGRGGAGGARTYNNNTRIKTKYTKKSGFDEGRNESSSGGAFVTDQFNGMNGATGGTGAGMGSVYLLGRGTVVASGGGTSNVAAGGNDGKCTQEKGAFKRQYTAGGGGAGAGGGAGCLPRHPIGGGGGGGGAGGAGGKGAFFLGRLVTHYRADHELRAITNGGGGYGGQGSSSGNNGAFCPAHDGNPIKMGGCGGNAGVGGANGNDGYLACGLEGDVQGLGTNPRAYDLVWGHPALERKITFVCEGKTIGVVAAQMGLSLPIIPENVLRAERGYAMACAYQVKGGVTNLWYGMEGERLHKFEGTSDVTLEVAMMPRWDAMAPVPSPLLVDYAGTNVVAFSPAATPWCSYVSGTTNATDAGLYRYSVKMKDDYEIWSDLETSPIHEVEWRVFKVAITNDWVTNNLCYNWTQTPEQNLKALEDYKTSLGFVPPKGVTVTFRPTREIEAGFYALEAHLDGGKNYFDRTMYGSYKVSAPIHVSFASHYPWSTKIDAVAMKRVGSDEPTPEDDTAFEAFHRIYGKEDLIAAIPLAKPNAKGERFVDVPLGKVETAMGSFNTITTVDLAPYADKLNVARTNNLEIYVAIGSNRFDTGWTCIDLTPRPKTDADGTWPQYDLACQEDVNSIRCSWKLANYWLNVSNILLSISRDKPAGDWFEPRTASGAVIIDDRVQWKPSGPGTYVLENLIRGVNGDSNGYYRAYVNYTGEPPSPEEKNIVAIVKRRSGWMGAYTTLAAAVADLGYGDQITIVGDVQMEAEKIPSGTTVLMGPGGIFRAPVAGDLRRPYHRAVATNGVINASGYRYELDAEKVRPVFGDEGDMPAIVLERDGQGRVTRFKVLVKNFKGDLYYTLKRSEDMKTWSVVSKETQGTLTEEANYVSGAASGDKGFYRVEVTDDPAPVFTSVTGSGGTITITGAKTGIGGELILPETIGTNRVTAVGAYAFTNRADITSVEIAEGVTEIGAYAFYGCTHLKTVYVPSTLVTIGEHAFDGCLALEEFDLPEGFRSLGAASFANTGLTELCLPDSVQEGASPGLVRNGQILYVAPGAKFGTKELGPGCFTDGTKVVWWRRYAAAFNAAGTGLVITNANLMKDGRLEIPAELGGVPVVEVGDGAFLGRSDLQIVLVPDSVTRVGHSAFRDCPNLREISFGTGLRDVGSCLFATDNTKVVTYVSFAGDQPRLGEACGLAVGSTICVTPAWRDAASTWQGCTVRRQGNDDCLTFASAGGFTLGTAANARTWDGTLFWSTNKVNWTTWHGEAIAAANAKTGAEPYCLYLRGSVHNANLRMEWNHFTITPAVSGGKVACYGNIESLRGAIGSAPAPKQMDNQCYGILFMDCVALTRAPDFPATSLSTYCYGHTFCNCTSLTSLPVLPAKKLAARCYQSMFEGCTSIKVNLQAPGQAWTISADAEADGWNVDMLKGTSGTFTGNPVRNTTYYVQ